MNARRLVTLGLFGALAACRSIVGVADLELVDGGSSSGTSGGPSGDAGTLETGAADSGTEASTLPPVDAGDPNTVCKDNSDCRMCCKNTFKALAQELETTGKTCFCNVCPQCASDAYCTGQAKPGAACVPCIDDKATFGECTENCTSQSCKDGISCLQSCPPK